MKIEEVRPGLVISNGSSAIQVTERVARDPRWKVPGWRGQAIGLDTFGGNVGYTEFVADYLLGSWRPVPFEWSPITGGALEERYVWRSGSMGRLRREVRRIEELAE